MKKNKSFNKLLLGQALANIGDTIYTIAVISSIFTLTKSPIATSLVPVIITASMFLSGLLTPLVTSRFSLNKILRISQLLKTLLLFVLAVYLQMNSQSISVFVLYILIAFVAFLDGCAKPVSNALIPHYVPKDDLMKANSIFESVFQTIGIGSWAVGSSLLLLFSISRLIWFDVAVFLIATIFMWLLPQVGIEERKVKSDKEAFSQGWKKINKTPLLKVVISMDILEQIAQTAWIGAIVLVFVKEALHVTENWWGYINAVYFGGSIIGGLICLRFTKKIDSNKAKYIFLGSLFGALTTFAVSISPNAILVVCLSALIGVFEQLKNIPQSTAIQKKIQSDLLAPVYASMSTLYTGCFALATLGSGVVSEVMGVRYVFAISGVLLFVVTIIARKNRELFED